MARYLVKAEARLRLGGPAAKQNTISYDSVKPTLKSVSQDVFSAKKTPGPNVTNLKRDFIRNAVHCSTHRKVFLIFLESLAYVALFCSWCFGFVIL